MPVSNSNKQQLKILQIFSRYLEYGGEEGSVYRIAKALDQNYSVKGFYYSTEELINQPGLRKLLVPFKVFHNWDIIKKLQEEQKSGKYQIWQIHNVFPALSPAVYKLAFKLRVPVVQYLHNYRFGCINGFFLNHGKACQRCMHGDFFPAFQTACWHGSHLQSGLMGAVTAHARIMDLFNGVHHWIAISDALKNEYVAMGVPNDRITVIPHFFESAEASEPYPVNGDALFVGRLSPEKGVDRLFQAWKLIPESGKTLWIVGDGPERGRLEVMSRTMALKNVRFTGFLDHSEMSRIWANAALSIVPSIWKEPFGMVVLEAWSKRRPVVAHRLGALQEIITHGEDGFLVPADNPNEMADAMQAILFNPKSGEGMGNCGKDRLDRNFSKSQWSQRIGNVFKKILVG